MKPPACEALCPTFRRICVVGVSGSGKTTLAGELARRLEIPHLELDSYHWQPGWKETDRTITRARVEEFTRAGAWVVDGNYSFLRDILWQRAEALIWLDYPLGVIMGRMWRRTWKRVIAKEVLWGTNYERLGEQFFTKDSIFLWALQTYPKHKKQYEFLPSLPEYSHIKVYRLQSPRQALVWLSSVGE